MLRAIIIDDEAKSRRILQKLLEGYCPNVQIIATATDILSGIEMIQSKQPDVVFLDIELPTYNGFKIFELINPINFKIIFTTAYEQYAIKAFKVAASDYLLKPIDIDELIRAVDRVKQGIQLTRSNQRLHLLREGIAKQNQLTPKLKFPSVEGVFFFQAEEILFLEAIGRNTKIYTLEQQIVTSRSLKECENLLDQQRFYRIHRSFIINLDRVFRYVKGRNSYVLMDNQSRIDIGNNFKEGLINALSAGNFPFANS